MIKHTLQIPPDRKLNLSDVPKDLQAYMPEDTTLHTTCRGKETDERFTWRSSRNPQEFRRQTN